jgi:hypothetical protein
MQAAIEQIEGTWPTWRAQNASIQLIVAATAHGLALVSLHDVNSGARWQGAQGHTMLHLTLNQPEGLTLESWQMRGWHVEAEQGAGRLDVEFVAAANGVTLALFESIWLAAELPVLRHWITLINEGTQPVRVGDYHMLDLAFAHDSAADPLRLFYVDAFAGHRRDRWEPGDLNFDTHEHVLQATEPLRLWAGAYQQQCSWLAVRRADGAGIVTGLEYDGACELRAFDMGHVAGGLRWSAPAALTSGVRLTAAPSDPLNAVLSPAGTWRSPAAFWALFEGDWDSAAHVTHDFTERYLAPALPDAQFPYVVFNSWGYGFDLSREALLRCLDVAAEIGVEMFDADYGWQRGLSDWTPVDEHMPLLGELSRMAHERGMKFGVWMAFANADPGVPILSEHPDWVAYPDGWGSFRSRALCLANPDTRDWVAEQAIRLVGEYDIDYLKHDFELITLCTSAHHPHPPDPAGYHSMLGYHEVLRRLRQAHPRLLIENCQGGGRIMTFDMVKLHDASISSDGPVLSHALMRRKALYNMCYLFPLRYCASYMEERPTDYACHSSMIGGPWILMDKASEWTSEHIASAKRNVALYKQIRPLFHGGRVYHLSAPSSVAWDAFQVQQPGGQGAVLIFQPDSSREDRVAVPLKGLDEMCSYRLRSGMSGEVWQATGAQLMQQGLQRVLAPGQSDIIILTP